MDKRNGKLFVVLSWSLFFHHGDHLEQKWASLSHTRSWKAEKGWASHDLDALLPCFPLIPLKQEGIKVFPLLLAAVSWASVQALAWLSASQVGKRLHIPSWYGCRPPIVCIFVRRSRPPAQDQKLKAMLPLLMCAICPVYLSVHPSVWGLLKPRWRSVCSNNLQLWWLMTCSVCEVCWGGNLLLQQPPFCLWLTRRHAGRMNSWPSSPGKVQSNTSVFAGCLNANKTNLTAWNSP